MSDYATSLDEHRRRNALEIRDRLTSIDPSLVQRTHTRYDGIVTIAGVRIEPGNRINSLRVGSFPSAETVTSTTDLHAALARTTPAAILAAEVDDRLAIPKLDVAGNLIAGASAFIGAITVITSLRSVRNIGGWQQIPATFALTITILALTMLSVFIMIPVILRALDQNSHIETAAAVQDAIVRERLVGIATGRTSLARGRSVVAGTDDEAVALALSESLGLEPLVVAGTSATAPLFAYGNLSTLVADGVVVVTVADIEIVRSAAKDIAFAACA